MLSANTHKIKIIIANADELTNASHAALLSSYEDFEVLGVAENGKAVLTLLRKNIADVVLMEANLPLMSGVETFRVIQQRYDNVKVIIKGKTEGLNFIRQLVEEDLHCYLSNKCGKEELLLAIRTVYKEDYFLEPKFAGQLLHYTPSGDKNGKLTKTEKEIISLVCSGFSSKEIAAKRGKSKNTINFHRSNIRSKTGCRTVAELINYAITHHISFEPRKNLEDGERKKTL